MSPETSVVICSGVHNCPRQRGRNTVLCLIVFSVDVGGANIDSAVFKPGLLKEDLRPFLEVTQLVVVFLFCFCILLLGGVWVAILFILFSREITLSPSCQFIPHPAAYPCKVNGADKTGLSWIN